MIIPNFEQLFSTCIVENNHVGLDSLLNEYLSIEGNTINDKFILLNIINTMGMNNFELLKYYGNHGYNNFTECLFIFIKLGLISSMETFEELINLGADINKVEDGNTPLSLSITKGVGMVIISKLLEKGADLKMAINIAQHNNDDEKIKKLINLAIQEKIYLMMDDYTIEEAINVSGLEDFVSDELIQKIKEQYLFNID